MFELVYPPGPVPLMPFGADSTRGAEMLPVVEPSGLVVGKALRNSCHGGTLLLHPVVHLHLFDREERLFLQKRSLRKDLLPGRWDTAVGGHVDFGEGIREALSREAAEELQLRAFNPVWLKSYVWESSTERELVCVFAAIGHFAVIPDPDEVSEGRWWTLEEIHSHFGKSIFTPNFEQEFLQVSGMLKALL